MHARPRARSPAGEWRGLPVAVKTVVYEATPGEEQAAAAVMETAISASVGHRNVVRWSADRTLVP